MGIVFNAEEILEIAEQIERNGQNFYKKAAENTSEERHKKLLTDLYEMEVEHEKTFANMKAKLEPKERESRDMDPENQGAAYLRAVADGHVFEYKRDPSLELTGKESIEEILNTALGMEKESVVFYTGIKDMVPERLGSNRISDIIKEELSHITLLSKHIVNLKS
ncbi:rubrerythrin [candidate division WOR-3 bacterium]|uniref:Rubrerythrin n=1 Tax=candidate division WOR-3 bacterium TaxID=2052148 RepID=A0A9D5KB19_UNCW3|nr:rubrerythrin [candidate division WOR-3 bacterium]MBD3364476.1 rubrerythrin [candidate division WOR-3 bacterium]